MFHSADDEEVHSIDEIDEIISSMYYDFFFCSRHTQVINNSGGTRKCSLCDRPIRGFLISSGAICRAGR